MSATENYFDDRYDDIGGGPTEFTLGGLQDENGINYLL